MSANPFLSLDDSTQRSSNPFLSLSSPTTQAVQSTNQAAAPYAAPFLAGAGQQLANIGHQIANPVASGLDATGLTQNSKQNVDNYFNQNVDSFYNPIMAQNPNAAVGGKVAGAIIGTAPTLLNAPGKLYQAGLGAANGYLNSDPDASGLAKLGNAAAGAGLNMIPGGAALATTAGAAAGYGYGTATGGNAAKDALIGAGVGLGGYAGGRTGINMFRGAKAALTTPTDIANLATQKTLDATGKDLSSATPEQFFQQVDNLKNQAGKVKNELYNARNDAADSLDLKLNLTPFKDDIDFYLNNANVTRTREGEQIIAKIKNNKPLTYSEAQTLSDLAGASASTASSRNDKVLSSALTNIKLGIDDTINSQASLAGDLVDNLHKNADDFFKNVYKPLDDIEAKKVLAAKFTEGKLINNALKLVTEDPTAYSGLAAANEKGLPNNLQDVMRAAHVNALKDAATDPNSGVINPKIYANSLSKTLKENPVPFEPITDKLQALGNALDVAKQSYKVRDIGTEHSMGQKIGIGLGASVAAGTIGGGATYYNTGDPMAAAKVAGESFLIPKVLFMYGAGRMLQNPTTRALLSRAATLSDQAPPETKAALSQMIAKKFQQQTQSIPAKLLPVFSGSANQQQQQ